MVENVLGAPIVYSNQYRCRLANSGIAWATMLEGLARGPARGVAFPE
ncbi:MAG: hypothetical protein AB7Q29_09835 [Vicinamibacterales bacterium]